MQIIDKMRKFVLNIKKEDKVGLLYHSDSDGVCSGVIVAKVIEKLRGKPVDFIFSETPENLKINKLIIVDIALDQYPKELKKLEKNMDVLILDHHKGREYKFDKTIILKSYMVSDIPSEQYCASKLCYDILKDLVDISNLDWICAIGIVGDSNHKTWSNFLRQVSNKYKIKINKDWFDSVFGIASDMIISAYAAEDGKGVDEAFECFYKAKKIDDVLNSTLKKHHEKVNQEIDRVIKEHRKKSEFYDGLIIYEFNSPYHIKSPVSNIISLKYYPNKTVIILQHFDDTVGISARRQDGKIAMNDLIKKCVRGLEGGYGGGHIPAAGGSVSKKDVERFKKNVIEYCQK